MKILTEPNKTLRQISEAVNPSRIADASTQQLIDDMIAAMKKANGVGIAAPQVGVNRRIIIIDDGDSPKAFINPRLTSRSTQTVESEEGCLSVPGVWGVVVRCKKVRIKAFDRQGKKVEQKVAGLTATIFQHEIDHLDGILFIDRVVRFTKTSTSPL